MSRFNPFDVPLTGEALSTKVQELADVVDQLAEFLEYMPAVIQTVKNQTAPDVSVFPAILTGYQSIGSNRWEYSWYEWTVGASYPSGDQPHPVFKPGRRDSSSGSPDSDFLMAARNGLEQGNLGSSATFDGVGAAVGDIAGPDGTTLATSVMLPIGVGDDTNLVTGRTKRAQLVMMTELPAPIDDCRFWFTASNAVKVECAE